jgi:hypothetical protein
VLLRNRTAPASVGDWNPLAVLTGRRQATTAAHTLLCFPESVDRTPYFITTDAGVLINNCRPVLSGHCTIDWQRQVGHCTPNP